MWPRMQDACDEPVKRAPNDNSVSTYNSLVAHAGRGAVWARD